MPIKLCEGTRTLLPLLKWPGGKRALLSYILPLLKITGGKYFEPFVGGGAVFFGLAPRVAVLADLNSELIGCYLQVQNYPTELAQVISTMNNNKSAYYAVRESIPSTDLEKAARLIYLTSLSFNGIYRQNLRGKFNVPYGYKQTHKLVDKERLLIISRALAEVQLRTGDFEETTADAAEGDFVYFDPPYTVAHNKNGFVKYNAAIFSWEDQRRLASHAEALRKRGCKVIVSNADHTSIEDLYPNFDNRKIIRSSVMAADSSRRKQVTEALFFA